MTRGEKEGKRERVWRDTNKLTAVLLKMIILTCNSGGSREKEEFYLLFIETAMKLLLNWTQNIKLYLFHFGLGTIHCETNVHEHKFDFFKNIFFYSYIALLFRQTHTNFICTFNGLLYICLHIYGLSGKLFVAPGTTPPPPFPTLRLPSLLPWMEFLFFSRRVWENMAL